VRDRGGNRGGPLYFLPATPRPRPGPGCHFRIARAWNAARTSPIPQAIHASCAFCRRIRLPPVRPERPALCTVPRVLNPRSSRYARYVHLRRVLYLAAHPRQVPAAYRDRQDRVRRVQYRRGLDRAFREGRGVIHVGANTGAERGLYDTYGLPVFWVEPIPAVFAELTTNIAGLPGQRSANALVAAEDDRELTLHVANNHGESSSIFEFAGHRDIWPEVEFVDEIQMTSVTLPTLLRRERLEHAPYDLLVLDTQGSELLILRGASSLLHDFRYIQSEVADFDAYAGGCTRKELTEFLKGYGFREWGVNAWPERSNEGGRYYEILYRRG